MPERNQPVKAIAPSRRAMRRCRNARRAGSRVGLGVGLGSTIDLRGPGTPRCSLSPELVFRYGRCCHPAYLLLSLRYDRFRDAGVYAASLGITYW